MTWPLTAGITAALTRRATEGGSSRVHVSLTRAALRILSLGLFDRSYAFDTAGRGDQHAYPSRSSRASGGFGPNRPDQEHIDHGRFGPEPPSGNATAAAPAR